MIKLLKFRISNNNSGAPNESGAPNFANINS